MELGREGDLEQHVLHHVATVGPLELEFVALEQHVVKAPGLGGQYGWVAHLAGLRDEREAHGAGRGVARRPALARTGVGRVAVGTQRLSIDPGKGHGIGDLFLRQAKHLGYDGGAGYLDQHDVIEPHLVEGIFQRDAALDFVGLDHAGEHIFHGERFLARSDGVARQPVCRGENAAEVIRWVTPLRGEPGVVEIQPADHRTDVEGGLYRIELELRAGDFRAVGHHGAGDDGPYELGAGRVFEGLKPAAQRVDQAVARGLVSNAALDLVLGDVVDDVDKDFIGLGADVGDGSRHCLFS